MPQQGDHSHATLHASSHTLHVHRTAPNNSQPYYPVDAVRVKWQGVLEQSQAEHPPHY